MLLAPLALALSALAVPIVAMYILKLRRREQLISSTFLWQRALDDIQANAPWQRLRPSILLALQLLALVALVLALAQPAYSRSHRYAGDLILIVDESYGMQAHDVAPSRFAVAVARAHALASDLPGGNVASVIGMGAQPQLKIAESSDGGAIGRAIDSLRPAVDAPNFLGALSLAASLARSGQTTRVVVLTSRESGISTLPLAVSFPVDIVRIGGRLRDLGITTFSASPGQSRTAALVRVGNFGVQPEGSDLDLYVDGQLADVRPLLIAPGTQQTIFWTNVPAGARSLHAVLTRSDDVSADKSAWAVVRSGTERSVLLVTGSDYFVQTALSLDPSVRLSVVAPSDFRAGQAGQYDLVVFDGVLPRMLPAAALLLSPPRGVVGLLRFGAYLPAGAVSVAPSPPPGPPGLLLRYVDLSDVHVARARAVSLPAWLEPLATAGSVPLLAAGESTGHRLALTTFALQESDWPLRVSFPIVMQNFLQYLVPGLGVGAADVAAGATVPFSPPPGTREIDITLPGGGTDRIGPPFAPFADTSTPGLYTAATIGGARRSSVTFAVNFFPARPAPASGKSQVTLGATHVGTSQSVTIPVSAAWICALAVLAVLSAEWWFAFRR
ncbi:MAG TPA: VWA domain-containing protein [Chloroflexota bacterium]|nr:VWA domain-containing protein [Chloroflexota bacterium]